MSVATPRPSGATRSSTASAEGERETARSRGAKARTAPLRAAYPLLRRRFGHQHWWPGETPFEVCVGAILTQSTSWTNVERAIAGLRLAGVLEPRRLVALSPTRLAGLIRPAGYFNVKARRLRAFLQVLVERFDADLTRFFHGPSRTVRERLLAIHGIGPETADSMLLYAGGHSSFVVDTYTKRIFVRHAWCARSVGYDDLKALCEAALGHRSGSARLDYWQDYHAQLVRVGKEFCRPREPQCEACPLKPLLPTRRSRNEGRGTSTVSG
jgi:endonuclease III related protein